MSTVSSINVLNARSASINVLRIYVRRNTILPQMPGHGDVVAEAELEQNISQHDHRSGNNVEVVKAIWSADRHLLPLKAGP